MSTIRIHCAPPVGRLQALLAAIARPIDALGSKRNAPPEGTPEAFSNPATWREVRNLPPHILRDIGFYD